MTTTETQPATTSTEAVDFLWLEITGKCQLECGHCYANSGPDGGHGSMSTAGWRRVIDQAAGLGVRRVQFIGGEPTLHPALVELIGHALSKALEVEVFSNLVRVTAEQWAVFSQPGVRLATSYYSDDRGEHHAATGRDTLRPTWANIAEARRRGIPIRVGVIDVHPITGGAESLVELGIPQISTNRVRGLGRAGGCAPGELCGRCGDGKAAVLPDGTVTPCVMARWASAGNVTAAGLGDALAGIPAAREQLITTGMPAAPRPRCGPSDDDCPPDGGECWPTNKPHN